MKAVGSVETSVCTSGPPCRRAQACILGNVIGWGLQKADSEVWIGVQEVYKRVLWRLPPVGVGLGRGEAGLSYGLTKCSTNPLGNSEAGMALQAGLELG